MVAERSGNEDDEDREDGENENADGGQGANGKSESTQQYLGLLYPSKNMQNNSEKGKDNFVLNP